MSSIPPVVTKCGYPGCANTVELTKRQMRRYRAAAAKGKLAETPFYCSPRCRGFGCSAPFPKIEWRCDNQRCRKEFELDNAQAKKHREDGKREFYCAQKCWVVRVIPPGLARHMAKFTDEDLEAYWAKVVDPTYYAGIRHSYATPLSWQDRGVKMARPTGARLSRTEAKTA